MTTLLQDLRYGLRLAEGYIPPSLTYNGKAFSLKMQAEIQTEMRTK
jgi:hypothetical protein